MRLEEWLTLFLVVILVTIGLVVTGATLATIYYGRKLGRGVREELRKRREER